MNKVVLSKNKPLLIQRGTSQKAESVEAYLRYPSGSEANGRKVISVPKRGWKIIEVSELITPAQKAKLKKAGIAVDAPKKVSAATAKAIKEATGK